MTRLPSCAVFALLLAMPACGGPGDRVAGDATLSTSVASEASAMRWGHGDDVNEPGRYAAGYVHYTIFDQGRSGDRPGNSTYSTTGRPIAFSIWYPVERRAAHHAERAEYWLDPYFGQLPPVSSLELEAQGIDPAFAGPALKPASGRWPVIVLSPGALFPDVGHASFGTRLASHGFIVVVIHHFGMQWWSWEPEVDHLAVLTWDRPRDMSFVLSDLLQRNKTEGDLLHRKLRTEAVIAAGWSLGGYAALTLASGDDSVCDLLYGMWYTDPPAWTCAPTPPDPRFKALVLFDAASQLLHFEELERVRVPTIALGETWESLLATGGPSFASWQARQHAALSGHPNLRLDVAAAVHYSFSDECEYARVMKSVGAPAAQGEGGWTWDDVLSYDCGPTVIPSATIHRLMTAYPIAFLKTYLLHEPGYRHMLTARWVSEEEPDLQFFAHEKCRVPVPTPDWPPDWVYYQQQPPLGDPGHDECPHEP